MRLVLDSGALVALERNDRAMWRRFKAALIGGEIPLTHGGVVGQGALLSRARRSDVIDAAVVLLAEDGDHIVTSDLDDLEVLAAASGRYVELVRA